MDSTAVVKAEEKKKLGNEEHKKGNYSQAVALYTEAISKGKIMLIMTYRFEPCRANIQDQSRPYTH
jgi:hypothetical protein